MNTKELLQKSEVYMRANALVINAPLSINLFKDGGEWMQKWLYHADQKKMPETTSTINFNAYGFAKYGICSLAFLVSLIGFFKISIYLTPLSVLVFYIVEVHFLFLFPLLIDRVNSAVLGSIRITYRIGLVKVLSRVIPLGFYMTFGLLNFSDPLRNWYKGCLAVLIWYKEDVRNRI